MKQTVTLGEAISLLVDDVLESHNLKPADHPQLKALMLQVAGCTTSLISRHFKAVMEPGDNTPVPDYEVVPFKGSGTGGGGSHSVH